MTVQSPAAQGQAAHIEKQRAEAFERLYERAFAEYGVKCLWSWAPVGNPTPEHARVIARALKSEGGRSARELAWKIEDACDAADRSPA